MKKAIALMAAFVLSCSLVLSGCGGQKTEPKAAAPADDQKVIELSFVGDYMEAHPTVVNGWKPWMKEVGEKTGGKLKINYFNPNTLCPIKELYASTVAGTVDIAAGYCGNTPGKFPVNELLELPLIAPSAEAGSLLVWEMYKKYPEWRDEFKDTKLLWQWTSATFQLHTTKKLVKSLDDLKGMKIIGWTPRMLETIKLLGANPVEITGPDSYLALQRGMADGVMCPLAPVRSYKISDAAKFHTIVDLSVGPFYGVMNKARYDGLPPEVKKVLDETTAEKMAQVCGKTLDQGAVADAKWLKENGHTFHVLSAEEKKRWLEAVRPLHEKWVKEMEAKGFKNARAMLEDALRLGEELGKKTGRGYQE